MIVRDRVTREQGQAVRMVGPFIFAGIRRERGDVVVMMPAGKAVYSPDGFASRYDVLSEARAHV